MARKNRKTDNWAHWLHLHNLDTIFPVLQPLEDVDFERKFYQRPENEVGLDDILSSTFGSPRTHVQFTPGHGATTMFCAALQRLKSQPIRSLYVAIDVGQYVDETEEIGDVIWDDIHRDVFRQLIERDWYPHLYGMMKQSFQLLFDSTGYSEFSDYLQATKRRLSKARRVDDEAQQALGTFRFSTSLESLGDLFTTLYVTLGVRTVLLFDLPRTAGRQHLLSLMGEIKAFDEQVRSSKEFPPVSLTEVYFGTASSLKALQTTYHRDYHVIQVPAYNRAEVYAILARHYGVQHGGPLTESLLTVLSASYVDDVWSAEKSLVDMISDLRRSLMKRLDCSRDDVSFGMFQDPVVQSRG